MRASRKVMWITIIVILAAAACLLIRPRQAQAAAKEYQEIPYEAQKIGSLYFKQDGSIKYAAQKDGVWKELSFDGNTWYAWTNGTTVYTVIDYGTEKPQKLVSCKITNGKVTKLKTLKRGPKKDNPDSWSISGIYKKNIYLTRRMERTWHQDTYLFKASTGKLKKIIKDCQILDRSNTSVIGQNELITDVSPRRITLYRIQNNGLLKKVRILGQDIGNAQFVKEKLYFASYKDVKMQDVSLYRANPDGSKQKKLGALKCKSEYNIVFVSDFKAKKCRVVMDGDEYFYTYKTKKLTPAA